MLGTLRHLVCWCWCREEYKRLRAEHPDMEGKEIFGMAAKSVSTGEGSGVTDAGAGGVMMVGGDITHMGATRGAIQPDQPPVSPDPQLPQQDLSDGAAVDGGTACLPAPVPIAVGSKDSRAAMSPLAGVLLQGANAVHGVTGGAGGGLGVEDGVEGEGLVGQGAGSAEEPATGTPRMGWSSLDWSWNPI